MSEPLRPCGPCDKKSRELQSELEFLPSIRALITGTPTQQQKAIRMIDSRLGRIRSQNDQS